MMLSVFEAMGLLLAIPFLLICGVLLCGMGSIMVDQMSHWVGTMEGQVFFGMLAVIYGLIIFGLLCSRLDSWLKKRARRSL